MNRMLGDGKQGNEKLLVSDIQPRVGRHPGRPKTVYAPGETFESNGLYTRQWDWVKTEAKSKGLDAAAYTRMVMDWWIGSVERSRSGVVATPEQDEEYEKLIRARSKKTSSNKNRKKSNNSRSK